MDAKLADKSIELIDLGAQQEGIRARIDAAISRVLDEHSYIMGNEVRTFEAQLAAFSGARHAISCANGTDALQIIMMAKGIGANDAVFCPAFTFTATPETVALLGATPIFIDVEEGSFNLDPKSLEAGIAFARDLGLTPRAVIAVDLFGRPADYRRLSTIAEEHDLWILADAAQSFGATHDGRNVGTLGLATATSFFPSKPLGCYGDGGAIFTDDPELAEAIGSIRVHGKGGDKYDIARIGMNSRLDTLQAAILIEKLSVFPSEVIARERVARRYLDRLSGLDSIVLPETGAHGTSVWAQFVIRVKGSGKRDDLARHLAQLGIKTAIYYPRPLHQQPAYCEFPIMPGALATAERLSQEVLALPMHAYLYEADQDCVVAAVRSFTQTTSG